MTPNTPLSSIFSSIARAIAPPAVGSVPVPNSSISTRELSVAFARISFILVRWELYVLKSFSNDCSSPISMNMSSNILNSLTSLAGTSNPHWNMYCSIPTVLRHTDFPPAFGPEMTRRCLSGVRVRVRGTICFFSFLSAASRIGWRPFTIFMVSSCEMMGFPASICIATRALALMKSISPMNLAPSINCGRYGRRKSVNSLNILKISLCWANISSFT